VWFNGFSSQNGEQKGEMTSRNSINIPWTRATNAPVKPNHGPGQANAEFAFPHRFRPHSSAFVRIRPLTPQKFFFTEHQTRSNQIKPFFEETTVRLRQIT